MLEAEYKRDLVQALEFQGWTVQAHEDRYSNFIPDLSFAANRTDGWIEVKYQDEPPAALNEIHHWTRGQQDWLVNRGRIGSGYCFLILGTRERNYVWKWDCLDMVRAVPLEEAVRWAWARCDTLLALSTHLNFRVRREDRRG